MEVDPAPLLLEGSGPRWQAGNELVDALPYVDQEYADPKLKLEVERLIEEEMNRGGKRPGDFLVGQPPVSSSNFEAYPMVAKAVERVRAGKPPLALDLSQYDSEAPSVGKRNDLYAWMSALENAKKQLQYGTLRIENLELMQKYGPNAWRVHNQQLEAFGSRLQTMAQQLSQDIEALNRERKLNQQAAAGALNHMKLQWKQLCHKNSDIEKACSQLEAELASLRETQQTT